MLLPIELIDVERVGKVNIIVATKATEVGDDALTGLDTVVVKGPALPLGEGEGDFEVSAGEITRLESCGTLDALRNSWLSRYRGPEDVQNRMQAGK